ncbi:acyltransferase family protein [uncultured Jannaschia sp.]|uniref:acyltransferase family protein n=1 Tax=uncultured Jannaschia sp. TaxID=293347 RepID=UPI00261B0608|nr:acyltransferase family protein [uncultured Jannaschia sp.]
MKYRSEIDGLRAIAVVPVILFHAGFELFSGGFVGVDVFFVISGFLITTIIIAEMEDGRFSLLKFYERRARRILPALFFVVLWCIPAAWYLLLISDMEDFAKSLIAVATFSSNILFWRESGYFDTAAELKPLLHTWSLAVEEQFYILFPLFLMASWRFGKRMIIWALVAAFVISLSVSHWGAYNKPAATFYLLPTRAWELLIGSFAAFYLRKTAVPTPLWLSNLLSASGLIAIGLAVFIYDEGTPFPSLYALAPTVGTVLIILFASRGTFVNALLSLKGFVWIGLISYSLYLWHQPLLAFARLAAIPEGIAYYALVFILTPIAAVGTWRFVEFPFRRGHSVSGQQVIYAASFASTCIAAIGLSIVVLDEDLNALRFSPAERALIESASSSPMRSDCHFEDGDVFDAQSSCTYFQENPTWAVYGNSHGVELSYALAEVLRPRGEGLYHMTVSGCSASYLMETEPHCHDFYASRLDFILNTSSIQRVVLAYRTDRSGPESVRSLVTLSNMLADEGKDVYLILQAPKLPGDIRSFIAKSRFVSGDEVVSISRETWEAVNSDMYDAVSGLHPDVTVVDLADAFCDPDECFAIRDAVALYFDDDHMSVEGARLATAHLARFIE